MSIGIVGTMLNSTRDALVSSLHSIEKNDKLGEYGKPVAQAVVFTVAAVAATALLGIAASFLEIVTAVATLGAAVVIVSPFFAENEVMKKISTTALSVLDQLLDRVGLTDVFEGKLAWVTKKQTAAVEVQVVKVVGVAGASVEAIANVLRKS